MKLIEYLKQAIPSKACRKWLFHSTEKRIPEIALLAFIRMGGALTGVFFALSSKGLVNAAGNGERDGFVRAALLLLLLIIFQICCGTGGYIVQERLSYSLDADLKKSLFHKILTADYVAVSAYHSGDLLHRINSDLSNITTSIILLCTSTLSLVTSLISASWVLYSMAPGFTLLIVPACAVLALFTAIGERRMKGYRKDVSNASGKHSGFMQEAIERLLIVQGLDVAPAIEKKAERLLSERIGFQKKQIGVQVKMTVLSSLFSYLGGFVSLVWCALKVLKGEFDYGTLVAITSLVSQLQGPLLALPSMIPQFITLSACTERILEIDALAKQDEPTEEDASALLSRLDCIRAEGLCFSYTDSKGEKKTVFESADFTLNPKGMTVITGPSGEGKSTLLKLLLGIYTPDGGELKLCMKDGRTTSINRSTRNLFSFAPQGNLILSGSIRENLLLSAPDATEEELKRAIYVSCMEDYLRSLPAGLDTQLGENGSGLSEGQVQRINIARAVLSAAPILLLDEVTSSLDMETERLVLERISQLSDKVCIVVTHRSAALELADSQLRISEGKAEEQKL